MPSPAAVVVVLGPGAYNFPGTGVKEEVHKSKRERWEQTSRASSERLVAYAYETLADDGVGENRTAQLENPMNFERFVLCCSTKSSRCW